MNGEDRVRFTVDIFGSTYKLVGTFDEKYVKQLSAFVNEHMSSIAKSNPRLDTQKVAILALVNMADDYFQLRGRLDHAERERAQTKMHIEELRKAFELSQEKERLKSSDCKRLEEQVASLEEEKRQLVQETEMSSAAWAECVAEWERKYEELAKERDLLVQEVAVAQEVAAASLAAAARLEAEEEERQEQAQTEPAAHNETVPLTEEEQSLLEKYNKLQEEYLKLQNEFNEWIQLTRSEPQ